MGGAGRFLSPPLTHRRGRQCRSGVLQTEVSSLCLRCPPAALPAEHGADAGTAVPSAAVLSKAQEIHLTPAGSSAPQPGPPAMGLTHCVASLGGVEGGMINLIAVWCPLLCCKEEDRSPGFAVRFRGAASLVGLLCLVWCEAVRKAP